MKKEFNDFEEYLAEIKMEGIPTLMKKNIKEMKQVEVDGKPSGWATYGILLTAYKPKGEKDKTEKLLIYFENVLVGMIDTDNEEEITKLEKAFEEADNNIITEIHKTNTIKIQLGEVSL